MVEPALGAMTLEDFLRREGLVFEHALAG